MHTVLLCPGHASFPASYWIYICFILDLHLRCTADKFDLFVLGTLRPAAVHTAVRCMQFMNVQLQLLSDSLTINLSFILKLLSTIHTPSVSYARSLKSFACAASDVRFNELQNARLLSGIRGHRLFTRSSFFIPLIPYGVSIDIYS